MMSTALIFFAGSAVFAAYIVARIAHERICIARAERRARIHAAAKRTAQRAAQRAALDVYEDTDRHAARALASWAALYDPTFEPVQVPGDFNDFLKEQTKRGS